jgi:hypothetical protein
VSRIERSFAAEADGGELVDAERVDTAALAEALAHGDPAAVTGLGVMSVTAPYERWCVVSELAERLGQIHCLLLLPPVRVRHREAVASQLDRREFPLGFACDQRPTQRQGSLNQRCHLRLGEIPMRPWKLDV